MILVLIYILTIFFGRDYFSIQEMGGFFMLLGAVWLLFQIKKISLKTAFQPTVLIIVGLVSLQQNDFLILKSFPLILSLLFFFAFIHAQVTKEFFLVKYIEKFKKLDKKKRLYLEKTHLIWVVITAINVTLHGYFLVFATIEMWTFYTTIGWYILLGSGVLFQIVFRKFYEKKAY